jgi:hypothetical protein
MLEAESAPEELIQALRDTNNDDDAHGDAIEWLNDNACAYPAQFEFEAGDLVLVNVEAEERS